MVFNTEQKPELTEGIDSAMRTGMFAPVSSTNPNAVWVAKNEKDEVFIMDQQVENGFITVFADVNWLKYTPASMVKQFLTNMLVAAAENIEKLAAAAPTVTGLEDKEVEYGKISGKLSVTATPADGAEYDLSYQWYSNTSKSNEGGAAISGATSSSLSIPADAQAGTYYYYCMVTATAKGESDNSATAVSDAATVTVNKAVFDKKELTSKQSAAAKDLKHTGDAQQLVTAPEQLPAGYDKVMYRLSDNDQWQDDIVKGTSAGEYTVQLKYVGDKNHADFETTVTVKIAEEEGPAIAPQTGDARPIYIMIAVVLVSVTALAAAFGLKKKAIANNSTG